jgi:hypothetical protein
MRRSAATEGLADQADGRRRVMADGGPVIQGNTGAATNITQTPTTLSNGAAAGDGTGMYLFGGAGGRGLYVVGQGPTWTVTR